MRRVVLDASVGVKWFRREDGSDAAMSLLAEHLEGDIAIVVCSHFCYEYMSVASRERDGVRAQAAWERLRDAEIEIAEVSDQLVTAAIAEQDTLGCAFYDALAPALATLLEAPLYSGDRRAHGKVPGVVLLGC